MQLFIFFFAFLLLNLVQAVDAFGESLPAKQIPCGEEQTDSNYQIVDITENTQLQSKDAAQKECVHRAHFRIRKSGVSFDCNGAKILGSRTDEDRSWEARLPENPETEEAVIESAKLERPPRPLYGILVGGSDFTGDLSQIRIKNCVVEGFERNFGIERSNGLLEDITIEDSKSLLARAYGVFVGPQVMGVTLRKLDVSGSQASGVFFSPGSSKNTVTLSRIVRNGTANFMPHQDGVTLDSSTENQIIANLFEKNGMSGVSLFHNCGEFGEKRPTSEANLNVIRSNHFKFEKIGAWIGSRQSMNQQHLSCSARKTFDDSTWDIVEDFAKDNTIQKNTFTDNDIGVRIEDDLNKAIENTFNSQKKHSIAILIGHRFGRPRDIRRPVAKVRLENNIASIASTSAYQYCFLQMQTEMIGNTSNQTPIKKISLAKEGCGIHEGPMAPPRLPAQKESTE